MMDSVKYTMIECKVLASSQKVDDTSLPFIIMITVRPWSEAAISISHHWLAS